MCVYKGRVFQRGFYLQTRDTKPDRKMSSDSEVSESEDSSAPSAVSSAEPSPRAPAPFIPPAPDADLQQVVDSLRHMRVQGVPFVENFINATGRTIHLPLRGRSDAFAAVIPPVLPHAPAEILPAVTMPASSLSIRSTLPSCTGALIDTAAAGDDMVEIAFANSGMVNVYCQLETASSPDGFRVHLPGCEDTWHRSQGIILPVAVALFLRQLARSRGGCLEDVPIGKNGDKARRNGMTAVYTVVPAQQIGGGDGDKTELLASHLFHCGISL